MIFWLLIIRLEFVKPLVGSLVFRDAKIFADFDLGYGNNTCLVPMQRSNLFHVAY